MCLKTPLPRPECRWRNTENEAGYDMANTRQRPPQSSSAAPFRPQMRRPSPSWARPQGDRHAANGTHRTAIPFPLLAMPNCSKCGAFHGCNSEPPAARECGQKRHGMEARRAETAKRVRFTTARRAGLVPARAPHFRTPFAPCYDFRDKRFSNVLGWFDLPQNPQMMVDSIWSYCRTVEQLGAWA